jgi:hypothetical protein
MTPDVEPANAGPEPVDDGFSCADREGSVNPDPELAAPLSDSVGFTPVTMLYDD